MFDFPHSVLAARLMNLLEGPKQQRATTIPEMALQEIVRRSEGEEGNIDEAEITAILERRAS